MIAVPMIGGMVSSRLSTLIVIPAVYGLLKGWRLSVALEISKITIAEGERDPALEAAEQDDVARPTGFPGAIFMDPAARKICRWEQRSSFGETAMRTISGHQQGT
jgi:hypothetical protein